LANLKPAIHLPTHIHVKWRYIVQDSSKFSGAAAKIYQGGHSDLLYALHPYVELWVWNSYVAHTDASLCIVGLFAEVADQLIMLHCTDEAHIGWNSHMHLHSDTILIDFDLSPASHCHSCTTSLWPSLIPYGSIHLLPCCTTKTHVVWTQKILWIKFGTSTLSLSFFPAGWVDIASSM